MIGRLLSLRRFAPLLGAVVLAGVSACAPTEPPVRSPLDDRVPQPTAPAATATFPPPFGTPPLGAMPVDPPADAGDPEAAVAAAIDAFADRTGLPAARFTVAVAEAETWPDGCLGVAIPGIACTEALVPGYRVMLRYQSGSLHEVRTGRPGQVVWAPQRTLHATVEQPGETLELLDDDGERHRALLSPSARLVDAAPGTLRAGDRVILGADDMLDGAPLRIAWLAREE